MSSNSLSDVKRNLDIFSMKVNQVNQGRLNPFFKHINHFGEYIEQINKGTLALNNILRNVQYLEKEEFQIRILNELKPIDLTINQLRIATIQHSSDAMKNEQEDYERITLF